MTIQTSQLTKDQKRTYGPRVYSENGNTYRITATVRYDDECGNGRNTFSITGTIDRKERGIWKDDAGGCIHDQIAQHFPELAPFFKWHLCSSEGPMSYVGNTLWHANNKDCHGLRKGEVRQIQNGRTGLPVWRAVTYDANGTPHELPSYKFPWIDSRERPADNGHIAYLPVTRKGEGKAIDLEAARSCAIWSDATLDELQDREKLEARLPALLAEFRQAIESLGFTY